MNLHNGVAVFSSILLYMPVDQSDAAASGAALVLSHSEVFILSRPDSRQSATRSLSILFVRLVLCPALDSPPSPSLRHA